MVELSVIIPAFDEEARIVPTVARIHEYLAASGMTFEVVVVDDGSRDRTCEVVRKAALSLPHLRLVENGVNRGKGWSVKNGVAHTSGALILFSDADLSTPVEELEKMLPMLETGADIVIGSRAMRESDIIKRQPIYRMLMGKTFNKLVRVLAVRGISDTQCGFKLFRRDTCGWLFDAQKVERFAFDVELLFLASKCGMNIREVPVRWINSPMSRVHIVRDSSRMLWDIIGIRLGYITGGYAEADCISSRASR